MKHNPGDMWIKRHCSFDDPPKEYFRVYEMTGAGSIHWPMIYTKRESAHKAIQDLLTKGIQP